MSRLGIILVFGVLVVAESITLGWRIGSQTRRACEAIVREQHARGWRQADVGDCVAAHLLDGRVW